MNERKFTSARLKNPLVSVVMSAYNGAQFIDQAISSIRDQTYSDFEFIIIDDGSTDATPKKLFQHAAEDSRIRLFSQQNRGLIESLHRGFAVAAGKYIARMDADDVAKRERLEMQLDFLASNPGVALVGGAVEIIDSDSRVLDVVPLPLHPETLRREMREVGNAIAHPTVLFDRRVFEQMGGFRKAYRYAEDYDLWLRMHEIFDLANLPEVLVGYRRHEASISFRNAKQQALSALCARITAQRRLQGRPDPTSCMELITETVLHDLGVDQETIDGAVLKNVLALAKDAIPGGHCSAAVEFGRAARPYAQRDKMVSATLELNRKGAALHWHDNLRDKMLPMGSIRRNVIASLWRTVKRWLLFFHKRRWHDL